MPVASSPPAEFPRLPFLNGNAVYRPAASNERSPVENSTWWQMASAFDRFRRALEYSDQMPRDWDGDAVDAPSEAVVKRSQVFLMRLQQAEVVPSAVGASPEGGVAFTFASGGWRGIVEFYNSGENAAAVYQSTGDPEVWEFDSTPEKAAEVLARLRVHFAA